MSGVAVSRCSVQDFAGTLLAIDTSMGTSVALGSFGRIVEASSEDPRGHAEVIGDLIARVFEEFDLSPADVDAVVAGMGPGPFTGLRVGIAAAHAFALGSGIPVLPLVSHDAAALEHLEGHGAKQARVIQDAKRRELFVTEYGGFDSAGVPIRTADPHLILATDYAAGMADLHPRGVSATGLLRVAARRLAAERPFEADRALYLRLPDVMQPTAPKRVST